MTPCGRDATSADGSAFATTVGVPTMTPLLP